MPLCRFRVYFFFDFRCRHFDYAAFQIIFISLIIFFDFHFAAIIDYAYYFDTLLLMPLLMLIAITLMLLPRLTLPPYCFSPLSPLLLFSLIALLIFSFCIDIDFIAISILLSLPLRHFAISLRCRRHYAVDDFAIISFISLRFILFRAIFFAMPPLPLMAFAAIADVFFASPPLLPAFAFHLLRHTDY